MDPLTIIVAALAAVGVLLVFVSLVGGSNVNARLERYAAAAPVDRSTTPKKDLGERFATSVAMANLNRVVERRDWGSNLARELARGCSALGKLLPPVDWDIRAQALSQRSSRCL